MRHLRNQSPDLAAIKGESIGESEWVTISQEDVNLFADATGDSPVDPRRPGAGRPRVRFGKTIAQRFHDAGPLLPRPAAPDVHRSTASSLPINYGLNKVRFPAPVPGRLSRSRAKSSSGQC